MQEATTPEPPEKTNKANVDDDEDATPPKVKSQMPEIKNLLEEQVALI